MDKLATLGQACLAGGLFLSLWTVIAACFSQKNRSSRMFRSAGRALLASAACTWGAAVVVWVALLTDRFDFKLVAEYSRSTQPWVYKFTALWGGMTGSLLFWAMILSLFMVGALFAFRKTMPGLLPVGTAVMALVHLFFMYMLNVVANPMEPLGRFVADGNGLNPLLQNYWMSIHPPMLYIGYIGFTVPFAFAVSALWNRRTDAVWITLTRRWTLFAFFTLGVGILMGGYWAYLELGWGGYWAWDPVENASLIPWLVSAALIHSVFIQERRGMFKLWNFSLLFMTFLLTIYGTFLTRSGVLSSVHAFASVDKTLSWFMRLDYLFLAFIGLAALLLLILIFARWSCFKADGKMESLLSRESAYFYGNVVILTLAAVVIYGVTWPWVYKLFSGQESGFTEPFYNAKAVPLGLVMMILMGVAPALGWKKTSPKTFWKGMRLPLTLSGLTAAVLPLLYMTKGEALGWHERFARPMEAGENAFSGAWVVVYSFLALVFVVFMSTVVIQEFIQVSLRKAKAKKTAAVVEAVELPFLNPRRFGGLIAHFSVGLMFIGVVGSAGFQEEKLETLKRGESIEIGHYRLEFTTFDTDDLNADFNDRNEIAVRAGLMVFEKGEDIPLDVLMPSKVFYPSSPRDEDGNQIPASEVAIRSGLKDDLYTVLAGYDLNAGEATFLVYVNPLVNFIWAGGILFALTAIPFLLPEPKRKSALARNIEEVA